MDPLDRSDPQRIGDITLHGRLGVGGMGRVFYGLTPDYEQVAVKVIREELADRAEVRARFAREVDALRTVQGPYVAGLVDASEEEDEKPWLAVEYVRGLSLKEFVELQGPLAVDNAAILGVLLATALKDVHRAGLLHRDLKPGNILMGREGAKVIDLGLVAFADGPTGLTTSESMLGTPACMSPEQANTPKSVTSATDVYALGATLLFALTKHYPYDGPNLAAMFMNIIKPEVAPNLGGLPAEFEHIVAPMLAQDPAARPSLAQVTTWLSEPATAGGITLPVAARRLAVATYVERPTDPPEIETPLRKRRDLTDVIVPGSVVALLAERLRGAYASNARF
ncbi:Serine/threonine protein kinase [Streptosporangium subroseum]|uniref:Serine/threonine protein kinase n=1 Tax=Streptosporangium subroseum TaxID=106412 RepID=A0A239BLF4_9ACTN|nr:serine/threonine-protein kinase [Streptosporangium subroseum]SNS08462.1 Serine/threonine protein kinase [Streptosporangium subroseum]